MDWREDAAVAWEKAAVGVAKSDRRGTLKSNGERIILALRLATVLDADRNITPIED